MKNIILKSLLVIVISLNANFSFATSQDVENDLKSKITHLETFYFLRH